MRTTLLFNPYLSTLGGGERFIYALASYIRSSGENVVIAAPVLPEKSLLARFNFDTTIELVQVGEDAITEYSRNYERLIYLTNYLPQRSLAKESHLVVQFPFDKLPVRSDAERYRHFVEVLKGYHCIVYSKYAQQWLLRRWKQQSMIIPPLVELGTGDLSNKEQLILSVGRFFAGGHSKRQDVLIDTFKQLPPDVQASWRLCLSGGCKDDDESREFVEALQRSASGHNISFEVNANQDTVTDLYVKARLFWHGTGYGRSPDEPEKAEHFGITSIEAMSFGCVPLVYDDGGQSEIVSTDFGRLWHSTNELLAMTTELVADANLQRALATNGIAAAQKYAQPGFDKACYEALISKASVVTIILGYNSRDDIAACIESALSSTYPTKLLFVDNDSRDDSEEFVRERFEGPALDVLQTGMNLGYAGGNNAGIRAAMQSNPEYILILNPDTLIDQECIGRMVNVLEQHPTVALVSPKIYYGLDGKRIWYAGSTMDWERGTSGHTGLGEIDDGSHDTLGPTHRACGAAMLFRTSVLEKVGLMDESYFLYFEEVDWSERFKQAGYEIWFVPDATCHHAVGSSAGGEESPLYRYYMTRNNLLFMSRFGSADLSAFRRFIMRDALKRVWHWLKHPDRENRERIKATFMGFRDYRRKRFGQRNTG